ncbi:MAG TPA: hypothetical protein VFU69_12540, partial [Ktedonobacterales bacterium]|nr:hypothetical protein [Ktedonobacterales bacterium]
MTDLALSKYVTLVADMPPIIAVRLPNGELSATLRSLCDLLDLDRRGQFRRIHRNPSLAEALQEAIISTPGGPQQAEVLLNWAISIWAAGLQTTRLPEAKRAAALILQRKAFAAIEQAFVQPENEDAAPAAPSQPSAPQSLWQSWHALIDRMEAEYGGIPQELRTGQQELGNQLAVVRHDLYQQGLRIAALEARDASPATGLSGQRLEYIFRCAHQFQQRH